MPGPEHVTVVASNAETLDGLQAYLGRAGLNVRGSRRLEAADADPCSAIVYFPDDFATEDVLHELHRLRRRRPSVLVLLVTSDPQPYWGIVGADGEGPAPLMLIKPAWGWRILEAIRDVATHRD